MPFPVQNIRSSTSNCAEGGGQCCDSGVSAFSSGHPGSHARAAPQASSPPPVSRQKHPPGWGFCSSFRALPSSSSSRKPATSQPAVEACPQSCSRDTDCYRPTQMAQTYGGSSTKVCTRDKGPLDATLHPRGTGECRVAGSISREGTTAHTVSELVGGNEVPGTGVRSSLSKEVTLHRKLTKEPRGN